jgi:hypothetical protein
MPLVCGVASIALTACSTAPDSGAAMDAAVAVSGSTAPTVVTDATQTYVHPHSGFLFPDRIGRFERVGIFSLDARQEDTIVQYLQPEIGIQATLYVYPVFKYVEGASASLDLLEANYDVVHEELDELDARILLLREETTKLDFQGDAYPGYFASYLIEFPDGDLESYLLLHQVDDQLFKVRISFPLSFYAGRAGEAIDDLLTFYGIRFGPENT